MLAGLLLLLVGDTALTHAVLAKTTPAPSSAVVLTTKNECVLSAMDLIVVMDQSGSVGAKDYRKALNAAVGLMKALTIGPTNKQSHFGFVLFNSQAYVAIPLNRFNTSAEIESAILGLDYSSGGTDIANGMRVAIQEFGTTPEDRKSLPKVMVIVTDGRDSSDVIKQRNIAFHQNITIYALGVGNMDKSQLYSAAGNKSLVYDVTDYSALFVVLDKVCQDISHSVPPVTSTHAPRQCPASYKTLWLDIVLVVDNSNSIGPSQFAALKARLLTFFGRLTVNTTSGQYTRVALVSVNSQAKTITDYRLSSEIPSFLRSLRFTPVTDFNLGEGLVEAQKIINSKRNRGERKNVKDVVILFSSRNAHCDYTRMKIAKTKIQEMSECEIAAHMVEDPRTVLITIGMKFARTPEFPLLNFGTPCFSFNNDKYFTTNLIKQLTLANCFCKPSERQFLDWSTCERFGECVIMMEVDADRATAAEGCTMTNSQLADVLNEKKENFLKVEALSKGRNEYWLGLMDKNGDKRWDIDNTPISAGDYTNWGSKQPDPQNGECVYDIIANNGTSAWFSHDCDDFDLTLGYFCQRQSCDAENYCP